jgi:hypothetical protein
MLPLFTMPWSIPPIATGAAGVAGEFTAEAAGVELPEVAAVPSCAAAPGANATAMAVAESHAAAVRNDLVKVRFKVRFKVQSKVCFIASLRSMPAPCGRGNRPAPALPAIRSPKIPAYHDFPL